MGNAWTQLNSLADGKVVIKVGGDSLPYRVWVLLALPFFYFLTWHLIFPRDTDRACEGVSLRFTSKQPVYSHGEIDGTRQRPPKDP